MTGIYRTGDGHHRITRWCANRIDRWPVGHERTTIETRLGATHLLEAGAGAVTVVYLPGTNFNAATSLGLLGELAQHCRVVAADLPGQPGLSAPVRPRRDSMRAYGGWADQLLTAVRERFGSGRLILAGHSLGAAVALSASPAGVDTLVLLNPAGLAKARVSVAVLRTALPWMVRPSNAHARALILLMSGTRTSRPAPDLVDWLTLVARHTRTGGAPGPLPEGTTDGWQQVPRRVISGEHDCFFPSGRLAAAARARLGIELEVFAELGHLTVEEDPAATATGILSVPA